MSARRIDLLLALESTGQPALGQGLPDTALAEPPKPRRAPRGDDAQYRADLQADLHHPPAQRWDIIAPAGPDGDRIVEAIAPLRRLREAQQGAPVRVHRAPPDMSMQACVEWKNDVYYAEGDPEHERALYLLLVGDLHQLSV